MSPLTSTPDAMKHRPLVHRRLASVQTDDRALCGELYADTVNHPELVTCPACIAATEERQRQAKAWSAKRELDDIDLAVRRDMHLGDTRMIGATVRVVLSAECTCPPFALQHVESCPRGQAILGYRQPDGDPT